MSYVPIVGRVIAERAAGEAIGAHRIVKLGADGNLYHASCTSLDDVNKIVGVSLNAADAGKVVRVLMFGVCKDPSFNFDTDKPLFLGTNGQIVQDVPEEALFIQRVGSVTGVHEILVELSEPVVIL